MDSRKVYKKKQQEQEISPRKVQKQAQEKQKLKKMIEKRPIKQE